MANITLKDIVKTYPGDVTAVHDLSLEIKDTEFVVLVGPSGCGKTTTLRMIAGLESISGGELYINGELVNNVLPKDRDIAMVFQNYALYPHMTVYKNMAFSLKLKKMPKDEIDKKVRKAAKILNLEPYLNRRPKELSGGERQRVALGRAMVRNPAVFLLDEPLSNLDAKLRTSMRSEITKLHKNLRENGTTFVYVTHDQIEAMTMGDRIVVMKDGYLQQADTPQNLYDRPCNIFVAGFIGSPPMNFLECKIHKIGDTYAACYNGAEILLPKEKFTKEQLGSYEGKAVCLGIRAENLYAENKADIACASKIEGIVENAELMGAEINLYARVGEAKVVARVSPKYKFQDGQEITFVIDGNEVHLFDKDTTQRIE